MANKIFWYDQVTTTSTGDSLYSYAMSPAPTVGDSLWFIGGYTWGTSSLTAGTGDNELVLVPANNSNYPITMSALSDTRDIAYTCYQNTLVVPSGTTSVTRNINSGISSMSKYFRSQFVLKRTDTDFYGARFTTLTNNADSVVNYLSVTATPPTGRTYALIATFNIEIISGTQGILFRKNGVSFSTIYNTSLYGGTMFFTPIFLNNGDVISCDLSGDGEDPITAEHCQIFLMDLSQVAWYNYVEKLTNTTTTSTTASSVLEQTTLYPNPNSKHLILMSGQTGIDNTSHQAQFLPYKAAAAITAAGQSIGTNLNSPNEIHVGLGYMSVFTPLGTSGDFHKIYHARSGAAGTVTTNNCRILVIDLETSIGGATATTYRRRGGII